MSKDKSTSVRVNSQILGAMHELGTSPTKVLNQWVTKNWRKIVASINKGNGNEDRTNPEPDQLKAS